MYDVGIICQTQGILKERRNLNAVKNLLNEHEKTDGRTGFGRDGEKTRLIMNGNDA